MEDGDGEAEDGLIVSIVVLDLASCGEGRAGGAAIFELWSVLWWGAECVLEVFLGCNVIFILIPW